MLKNLFHKLADAPQPETDIATVVRALATGPISIIDVREPEEWRAGHIAGAVHIPLGDLARRVHEVDAGRPVVTVCRSGRRSLDAVRILQAAGVDDVRSMAGGMLAWQEANQPIAR